jgi:A/G-specific adenine glycosylase
MSTPPFHRDADVVGAVERWFAINARDLPWRRTVETIDGLPRRNPYYTLVSELMCQQTQVSRVVDRFRVFIERFPTIQDLAAADETEILSLWSGRGYYRRARLLHAAARYVVDELNSVFPADPVALRRLPGVGRYTAGAIASMALGQRTPVVDGNVVRVLLRLDAVTAPFARTADKRAEQWAWSRAEALVSLAQSPGTLNEGLMELGALVCTPSSPKCDQCPLAANCLARRKGVQSDIPAPREAVFRTQLLCAAVLVRDQRGHILVQRRLGDGMWAGLFQVPTLEHPHRRPAASKVRAWLLAQLPRARGTFTRVDSFVHHTTHREVHFDVWRLSRPLAGDIPDPWTWVDPSRIDSLGISTPQRRILLTAGDAPPDGVPGAQTPLSRRRRTEPRAPARVTPTWNQDWRGWGGLLYLPSRGMHPVMSPTAQAGTESES